MKTVNRSFSVVVAIVLVAFILLLVMSAAGTGLSAAVSALLAATSTPPQGDPIPLKPIEDLSSLTATVQLDVNGLINGKRAQGDLNAVLATSDQGNSQITVTGSLLGEIAAQVGGSLVGLFTPSKVDIYRVPDGTYIVVNGLFPVCVKPTNPKATKAMDEMSPQNLLSMVTSSDVARGKFVGDETLNGLPVKHYAINGQAFLAAAQKSSNSKLRDFSKSLWSAEDADLFVDAKGGYPLAYRGSFSGTYEPLKFEGDFDAEIQLTGVNTNPQVNLPKSCDNPISK